MILPVKVNQQQTSYSCVASVYQALSLYYQDIEVSHEQAIIETKCDPDGAPLDCVGTLLGMEAMPVSGDPRDLKVFLATGSPVICNDSIPTLTIMRF